MQMEAATDEPAQCGATPEAYGFGAWERVRRQEAAGAQPQISGRGFETVLEVVLHALHGQLTLPGMQCGHEGSVFVQ